MGRRSALFALFALVVVITSASAGQKVLHGQSSGRAGGLGLRSGGAWTRPLPLRPLAPARPLSPPISRPAPITRSQPVTRPAPPLRRGFGVRPPHHRHRHDRPIILYERPFFTSPWRAYPYGPYSYSYFQGGAGQPWPDHYDASSIDEPFYCSLDGIGFRDSTSFAEHLHEAHGLPLDTALASTESVDGHLIYFGAESRR